ncbi:MAG: MFS transporter [Armatimonadaceae bacterium]
MRNGQYKEILRIPAFRNLYLGQTISQLGDALYYLIFLFMVEKITGDPRWVGVAGVAQALPFLLLSPQAGVLADRLDRRRIMLAADFLSTFVLLGFALIVWQNPTPPAWSIIACGALLSTINVFFAPAKGAAIPQIVPEDKLMSANALSMATQNLMPMIGIALSGTVLGVLYAISPTWFFLSAIVLNSLSFLGSALFIRQLPPLLPSDDTADAVVQTGPAKGKGLKDILDGLAYMRQKPALWMLLWLNVLVNLAISPFMLVYIQVNSEWFGGGYGTLALCEFSFFLGVVLCSLGLERLNITRPGMAYIWGLAGIGITIIFMAVSRNVWAFAFWNLIAGLAFPFAQIPMTAYIQRIVARNYQGRVNAALTMTNMGIQPVSIGLGGLLLAAIGPSWMLAVMGAGMAVGASVGLLSTPFRRAGADDPVQPTGGSPAVPAISTAE